MIHKLSIFDKVKITDISSEDAFYDERHKIIGKIGNFATHNVHEDGFFSGRFYFRNLKDHEEINTGSPVDSGVFFFSIKVEEVK